MRINHPVLTNTWVEKMKIKAKSKWEQPIALLMCMLMCLCAQPNQEGRALRIKVISAGAIKQNRRVVGPIQKSTRPRQAKISPTIDDRHNLATPYQVCNTKPC